MLLESFRQVLGDDRISEIIISDDASNIETYAALVEYAKRTPKIRLHRNAKNIGVYKNKYESVKLAFMSWVIVFDSDNIIGPGYLDTIFNLSAWDPKVAYNPDFGKEQFDFRHFSGRMITKNNVAPMIREKHFESLINVMNYFVNRDEFLRIHDDLVEPISADSIYKNYMWLAAGNAIYVVPGLQYMHRVHKGSHYLNNCARSNVFHSKITNLLKRMK